MKKAETFIYAAGIIAVLGLAIYAAKIDDQNMRVVKVLEPLPGSGEKELLTRREESNLRLAEDAATVSWTLRLDGPERVNVDLSLGRMATVANIDGIDAPNDKVYRYGETCLIGDGGRFHIQKARYGKYVVRFRGSSGGGTQCPDGTMFFAVNK